MNTETANQLRSSKSALTAASLTTTILGALLYVYVRKNCVYWDETPDITIASPAFFMTLLLPVWMIWWGAFKPDRTDGCLLQFGVTFVSWFCFFSYVDSLSLGDADDAPTHPFVVAPMLAFVYCSVQLIVVNAWSWSSGLNAPGVEKGLL